MKVENLYAFHQAEKAILEEKKLIEEKNIKKQELLAYSEKYNSPLYVRYQSKQELTEKEEQTMRKSYAQIKKLQKDIEENNLRLDKLEKNLEDLYQVNPELKIESDNINAQLELLKKEEKRIDKDYEYAIAQKDNDPLVVEENYDFYLNANYQQREALLNQFLSPEEQEIRRLEQEQEFEQELDNLTQEIEQNLNLNENIENSPEFLQWQEQKKSEDEQTDITEKLTATEYLEEAKKTLSATPLIEAENQVHIAQIEEIQNFSRELKEQNQNFEFTFDKEEMEVTIDNDKNVVNLNNNEIDKIDFENLSKQITSQLILELNTDETFKNILQEKQKEGISYDIIDYLQDTIKEAQQNPDLQGYYEFMKSQNIAVGEVALEQIQKDFPNLRGEALIANAEKIGVDNLIKAIQNTDEFKKFEQTIVLSNGEKPNALDYLKKMVAYGTPMNAEQLNKFEKQIQLIEKHYPEMDNSFQLVKAEQQELTAEQKQTQIQKEKENIKNSLANRIKEHLDKNSQGISQNPDQLAQEIMRDVLMPLKLIEFNRNKISLEQKKDYNITINFNGRLYKILGYENNYEKIKLQDIESQKQYTITNEKTFRVHFDGANLTPYQIDQLREGKKFIIASDSKTPIIATMKQGQIQFSTVDKETMDKSIRAKKGITTNTELNKNIKNSLIVDIKENKTPSKKNSIFKKIGF